MPTLNTELTKNCNDIRVTTSIIWRRWHASVILMPHDPRPDMDMVQGFTSRLTQNRSFWRRFPQANLLAWYGKN